MMDENVQESLRLRACRPKSVAWTLLSMVSAFLYVPAAFAERTVDPPESTQTWLSWALLVAFAGLCCGIAFKNPKRSHQA